MKPLLIILTLLFFILQLSVGQIKIFDTEAKNHIGDVAEVIGKVNSFKILNSKTTLLFCGAKYPKDYFIVIVENNKNLPAEHFKLADWTISVSGPIIRFKNMPAIKVANWSGVQTTLLVDHVPTDI